MNTEEIEKCLKSSDSDLNSIGISQFYTLCTTLVPNSLERLANAIIYYLWRLPKFKAQKSFIDELLSRTDTNFHSTLFSLTVKRWPEIQSDRKDKFYYLIKRLILAKPLDLDRIKCLFQLSPPCLRNYAIKIVLSTLDSRNDQEEEFLAEFISKCDPGACKLFAGFVLRAEVALKYAKNKNIRPVNRAVLYGMVKKTIQQSE